jgi:hypothetical protein
MQARARREAAKSLDVVVDLEEWCRRGELNTRPHPYQGCALPLSYGGTGQAPCLTGPEHATGDARWQGQTPPAGKNGAAVFPACGRAPRHPGHDRADASKPAAFGGFAALTPPQSGGSVAGHVFRRQAPEGPFREHRQYCRWGVRRSASRAPGPGPARQPEEAQGPAASACGRPGGTAARRRRPRRRCMMLGPTPVGNPDFERVPGAALRIPGLFSRNARSAAVSRGGPVLKQAGA